MKNIRMGGFYRAALTVIVMTLTTTALLGAASAQEWRRLASTEHKVVFSAPGLQGWNPGISVDVNDQTGGRAEWMCWRGFDSLDANACITFQEMGGRGFAYQRVTAIPEWAKAFKSVTHEMIGKVQSLPSVLGKFDTIRLKVKTKFHKKNCAIFSKYFSGNRKIIKGWYCSRVGEDLPGETVTEIISTIGLKGKKVPSGTPILAASAPVRAPSAQLADAYKRSLAIREKALGPEHPDVATSLNELAGLYSDQGRYAAAEPFYKRALAIREEVFGPEHLKVAKSLNTLALLYRRQGRYAEAEPLYKRSLAVLEKALGPDHPDVAGSLNNLAYLYNVQGRYEAAEPLHKRALAIREKALGPDHPDVATSLNDLAELYRVQGRYEAAEPLYKRVLVIYEKALGPDHPWVATSLNNLAFLYNAQGRYLAAERFSKRALSIDERHWRTDHPETAIALENLAILYKKTARYTEAEAFFKRSLAIREKAFGPNHPAVARSLDHLASFYRDLGSYHYADALDLSRRASAIYRLRREEGVRSRFPEPSSQLTSERFAFLRHMQLAMHVSKREPQRRTKLLAEAFEAGQLAQVTGAAAAVARMGARFAAGDDALARAVRARQDAVERWRNLDARLVKALSEPPEKRDTKAESKLRDGLTALNEQIGALDARLAREFPAYAELASPKPLSLSETQDLLGPAEALITYAVWEKSTFLWVIRHDDAAFHRLDIGRQELDDAVMFLRADLDPTRIRRVEQIPPFDTTLAYELYGKLFAPAEPLLEGAHHVFVVPDAGLQSLPLGVLVTAAPTGEVSGFAGYREVPWLAKKYAMTVLPSVSSLRALRQFAKAARASKPFVGFGDPLLEGDAGKGRGIDVATLFARGPVADVEAVRKLPRLPETADEILALAEAQGADESTVFLRERATETMAKGIDLSDFRVLAFATHGLVGGELKGVSEPALVLTPPETGTAEDDGLLTASEIATLDLDADLVILSACNTAAADGTPGAEGLSGLAKAFFYAGARALLVSHWSVNSEAAVAITTTMLKEMADNPDIGRAEALRRSMLAMLANEEKDYFAHPMFWAPFVVVGEGGAAAKI